MKVRLFKKALKALLLLVSALVLIFLIAWTVRKIRVVKETSILKTNHFQITYKGILTKEAEEISRTLEENYDNIRTELQDPKHEVINVFIHPNQKDFNSATGLKNSTANGTSRGPNVFHLMYQTWFNSIFPDDMARVSVHEFTHCVQLNILIKDALLEKKKLADAEFDRQFEKKFLENYPQWLWEALSDYEAGIVNKMSVKHGMKSKPSLKSLNKSNQIYNVGYTIIEYMVSKWGKDKLPAVIRTYCNFEEVLHISELEFEQGWYSFIQAKY